jgi:hypothetical protein
MSKIIKSKQKSKATLTRIAAEQIKSSNTLSAFPPLENMNFGSSVEVALTTGKHITEEDGAKATTNPL